MSKKNGTSGRRPMSNAGFLALWVPILALLGVLVIGANVGLSMGYNWVASQLGTGTYEVENPAAAADWDSQYYKSDFATIEDVDAAAKELVQQMAEEGIVLAKNTAGALPLAPGSRVTMLGSAAAKPIFGGAGSGSVDTSTAVTARVGLENAGFQVNATVYDAIEAFAAENPRGYIEMDQPDKSTFQIGEMPVSGYEAVSASFAQYNDAALIYIGRPGGEGGDLTRDMSGWDENYTAGQHQLELNKDELDLIALATEHFETVVVLVNASTSMELGPVQDNPDVAAVLLIGSPGATGFNAVGDVLRGAVSPSGRTVDLWARDFRADPTFVNFGDFVYSNLELYFPVPAIESAASNAIITTDAPFVNYQEGLYFGYRYYETAAVEGFIDYDSAVVYPFGYGLSYTTFEWELAGQELGSVDGTIALDVRVTNTGQVPGKDVVELYYSAPYTPGGIEKPAAVLAAFAKTAVLAPGASETVRLELAVEDMASYDHRNAQAYVLEAGDYELRVQTDSHNLAPGVEPVTYTVGEEIIFGGPNNRASDAAAVTNRFDDVSAMFADSPTPGQILNMSRADFAGTFPTAPEGDLLLANDDVAQGFAPWDTAAMAADSDVAMPTTGAGGNLTLIDLRGLPYDDPKWQELLDSLTVSEMQDLLLNGAYQTAAISSIAKPPTVELDGPAGFSSFINASINGVAYPSQYLIAQTWNADMAAAMGAMIGNESIHKQVSGWYAPAINLHRSPFGGRNFEYYSEDPYLSGAFATATSNGAAQYGLYTMLKHFSLNDQEDNRVNNGIATWATEQVIREVYLKPFEMAVKDIEMPVPYISDAQGNWSEASVGATGVMSSFNRIGSVWAGGSRPLQTDVLRGEWGFEGFVISDFNLYPYMNTNQSIYAGTDLTLTFAPSKSFHDATSARAVHDMQIATHNILFTVANSNAMNGLVPGAVVHYTPPTWQIIFWAVSALLGAAVLVGTGLVIRRVVKHRALPAA